MWYIRLILTAAALTIILSCSTLARVERAATASTTTTTSTTERKLFTSKRLSYSMTYPADWVVVEQKAMR